jgi:hypothetical protein
MAQHNPARLLAATAEAQLQSLLLVLASELGGPMLPVQASECCDCCTRSGALSSSHAAPDLVRRHTR